MPQHDPAEAMGHMLEFARKAVGFSQRRTRRELDQDEQLQFAILHAIGLIGEAANRVPREVQQHHRHIPWPQIISTRNRLIHGYDVVDLDLLWETVRHELPQLIADLEAVLESGDGNRQNERDSLKR